MLWKTSTGHTPHRLKRQEKTAIHPTGDKPLHPSIANCSPALLLPGSFSPAPSCNAPLLIITCLQRCARSPARPPATARALPAGSKAAPHNPTATTACQEERGALPALLHSNNLPKSRQRGQEGPSCTHTSPAPCQLWDSSPKARDEKRCSAVPARCVPSTSSLRKNNNSLIFKNLAHCNRHWGALPHPAGSMHTGAVGCLGPEASLIPSCHT